MNIDELCDNVVNHILATLPEGLSEEEALQFIECMLEMFEKWERLVRERISENYVSV